MNSKKILDGSLRRLKPQRHRKAFTLRNRSELAFLLSAGLPYPKLLFDTTVYIDGLQYRLSEKLETAIRAASIWHTNVTEAELSALSGLLDPGKAETSQAIAAVARSIEQRPAHRILNPDREVWREAGILAGLLARLQGYGKDQQRRALNDALIFLTAAKHGCAVLTRNLSDFDLLMQLDGRGMALFYDRC